MKELMVGKEPPPDVREPQARRKERAGIVLVIEAILMAVLLLAPS